MIVRHLRYSVRREAAADALAAARAYADEVNRKEGGTARYEVYHGKEDPTRFVHVMAFRTPSAEDYHRKTAWAKAFQEKLAGWGAKPEAEDLVKVE